MHLCKAFVLLALLGSCVGYSLGPPLEVCANMTPGHQHKPQTIPSPFSLTLNATEYSPGDVIKVFLNSSGDWFLEGTLIQMRKVNCGGTTLSDRDQAVGTFMTEKDDKFLQTFNCFNKTASALCHYSHLHIYNRTFYWQAPEESVGHVRIRATIVRNFETYWLNVMSDYLWDSSDDNRQRCGADAIVLTYVVFISALFLTYILS